MVHKFIRRILSVVVCCFVLVLGLFPVSAADIGSGSMVHSVLPFDTVEFVTGSQSVVLPWGLNEFFAEAGNAPDYTASVGSNAGYTGVVYIDDDVSSAFIDVFTGFNLASITSLRLYADNLLLTERQLREGNFSIRVGVDQVDFEPDFRVSVSFNVRTISQVGTTYLVSTKHFEESAHGANLNIFDVIDAGLDDGKYRNVIILIEDLTVVVSDVNVDPSDNVTQLYIQTSLDASDFSLAQWVNQFQLSHETIVEIDPANPEGVDLVSWLGVAVGGFLDFELWPGTSLNDLLWLCLVIGVLFLFLKFTT